MELSGIRPVRILGRPGLRAELVAQLVLSAGVPILIGDEVGATSCVTLLVEPARAHWAEARDGGGGIVLVAAPGAGEDMAVHAMLQGADAVVDADAGVDGIVHALDVVGRGGALVPVRRLWRLLFEARAQVPRPKADAVQLTPREVDILVSIDAGHSVKQTARALGISVKTVENLQSRMFRKLEARNRAQAISKAHAMRLLDRQAS